MKSVLESLFYGDIRVDEAFIPTETYKTLNKRRIDLETKFTAGLTEQQVQQFETYMMSEHDLDNYMTCQKFSIGFCLGVRTMLEVMTFETA